jgi:hypothetical protein
MQQQRLERYPGVLGVQRQAPSIQALGEIEATGRAYHTQAEIIPGVAHNSMLEPAWQTIAGRILVWLKEQDCRNHSAAQR